LPRSRRARRHRSARLWLARREDFLAYPGKLGVWVDANEGPEALAGDVARLSAHRRELPKFGDGRGYSIAPPFARTLGYKGELRAIGDVLHDHLYFSGAVRLDAFRWRRPGRQKRSPPHSTLSATSYQATVLRPVPLFRAVSARAKHDRSA